MHDVSVSCCLPLLGFLRLGLGLLKKCFGLMDLRVMRQGDLGGGVSGGWRHGDLSGTDVLSGRCK